jgi:hypothetical protein
VEPKDLLLLGLHQQTRKVRTLSCIPTIRSSWKEHLAASHLPAPFMTTEKKALTQITLYDTTCSGELMIFIIHSTKLAIPLSLDDISLGA